MQDITEAQPTVPDRNWSGFGCAAVGCLSYGLFAVVQTAVFFVVLFRAHPEAKRYFGSALSGVAPPANFAHLVQEWTKQIMTAPNLFLLALVGDGAMILCAVILARWILGSGFKQLGLRFPAGFNSFLMGVGTGIVLVIVSQLVSALQAKMFGPHTEAVAELLKTHHGTSNFFFDFAAVCAIAPFAEELLFRGVIFAGLAQRLPLWLAVWISGAIFGIAHLDLWSVVPLATIGAGLALLYHRTGSLWPNIIAHATVNSVALVAVYFLPQFAT